MENKLIALLEKFNKTENFSYCKGVFGCSMSFHGSKNYLRVTINGAYSSALFSKEKMDIVSVALEFNSLKYTFDKKHKDFERILNMTLATSVRMEAKQLIDDEMALDKELQA